MTSATVQAPPETGSLFRRGRLAFRAWRRTRPFWAGLMMLLAAAPILYFPYGSISLGAVRLTLATTAGAGSAVIGVLLIALAFSIWFQPMTRYFAGVASIVLSLVSLPVSNLGGYGLGMIFGLLGGAMALSWAPDKPVAEGVAESVAVGADTDADAEADESDASWLLPAQAAEGDAASAANDPLPGDEPGTVPLPAQRNGADGADSAESSEPEARGER